MAQDRSPESSSDYVIFTKWVKDVTFYPRVVMI